MNLEQKFPQKRAFISGAASGLGLAICERLAASGWKLLICDINEERLSQAEVKLQARVNGEIWSQGSPGKMAWTWGEMLAFAGEGVRFEPGDVFGSGTVGGGCGLELGRFLEHGDVVELDGGPLLGTLTGTVELSEGPFEPWRRP